MIAATHADPATQVIPLPQRNGETGCIVCAIPFIRPRDVLSSQAGQSAEEKQRSLQTAPQENYAAVHAAALAKMAEFPGKLPIVATVNIVLYDRMLKAKNL